jgi:hypothetical protein
MEETDDSKRRMIQINDWTYHDKMETLFIFQLSFIGFATTAILLILSKYGFFSQMFAIYTGIACFGVLFAIWMVRGLFTKNIRDKKHWNERSFEGDNTLKSLVPPAVLAAAANTNAQVCKTLKPDTFGAPGVVTAPATISCP